MYPYLTYATLREFVEEVKAQGGLVNIFLFTFFLAAALTVLNLKWTYDMTTRGGYLGVQVERTGGKVTAMQRSSTVTGARKGKVLQKSHFL